MQNFTMVLGYKPTPKAKFIPCLFFFFFFLGGVGGWGGGVGGWGVGIFLQFFLD